MGRVEKTVFISYRHTKGPWALAIYQYLTYHGYDAFMDYRSINSGDFEQAITENIKARAHFLVLLAPSVLEGCEKPSDWLRREIEIALETKRNIVPIMLEGFDFGSPESVKYLSGNLDKINYYQGLKVYFEYFDEAMEQLCNRFLNIPLDAVIHPVTEKVKQIIIEQQRAINEAEKVDEKTLSAQEWFERGYTNKDIVEQIRCYTNAVELDSNFAAAYNNRGICYGLLEQYERAIIDFDKVIKLNPDEEEGYNNRGFSYASLEQYKQAIDDYDHAIRLNPEYPYAFNGRGICYSEMGQLEWAIEDYNQAIELDLQYFNAFANRGNTFTKMEQYQKAIEDYDQAIKLNPESPVAYYGKASCNAIQGNVFEAIKWLRKALIIDAGIYCKLVAQDSEFDRIRDDEEFQKLLAEFCEG